MTCNRPASVEAMCLQGEFEALRRVLLSDCYAPHRQRPLSDWVENGDRRLPLPFLSRSVGEILETPFESLRNTPGVGQRKLRTLICLLDRVRATPPQVLSDRAGVSTNATAQWTYGAVGKFDPHKVSDVLWEQWRATVARLGIEDEPLGRFAPSLKSLVRTLWWQPLRHYTGRSLPELHKLRVHGDKRVQSILEVFYHIHRVAGEVPGDAVLGLRLVPRAILQAETWLVNTLADLQNSFTLQAFRDNFISPLLSQLEKDANPVLAQVAEARLDVNPEPNNICQIARRFRLTRARIYQLLREISEIIRVRWPVGRHLLQVLLDRVRSGRTSADSSQVITRLELCLETFFGEGEPSPAPPPTPRRKKRPRLPSPEPLHAQSVPPGPQTSSELVELDHSR
ncbi:MAG: hypothetical protein NZ899_01225 [Thermoguttaceae bacterium]|nr:hypothetical protein [Thermoguttaceae bacterium]MDW8077513.1 hypothetical protein [Thermoguttaceae bacterium]